MIEIFVLITAGKAFYQLALDYNKNKWLYAVLGPLFYFISALCVGGFLGIMVEFFNWNIDFDNKLLMTFIALPVYAQAPPIFFIKS